MSLIIVSEDHFSAQLKVLWYLKVSTILVHLMVIFHEKEKWKRIIQTVKTEYILYILLYYKSL